MKARLLTILEAWRKDWEVTRSSVKVVLVVVTVMCVVWMAFATWFWFGYRL